MRYLFITVLSLLTTYSAKAEKVNSPSLAFRQNVGQVIDQYGKQRKDILFSLSVQGMSIFIAKDGLHYQWYKPNVKDSNETISYRMDMVLIGANTNATIVASGQQQDYEQYYTNGLNGAVSKGYKKLVIKNIYPDINWVLYFNENTLKYDFEVGSKGDVAAIKLRYEGAKSLSLVNGNLIAQTPFGNIKEQAPISYDRASGQPIHSSFMLKGNELSYNVAQNNNVTIDPILDWMSYYGGAGGDAIQSSCIDNTGNVYFTGGTSSTANIATTGAYMVSLFGGSDGYLAKFTPYGQRIWATYFGGEDYDYPNAVLYSTGGGLYIAGGTYSSVGLASATAYQQNLGGGKDGFIANFTPSGNLIWTTYYGGSSDDAFNILSSSASGDIYAAGRTKSTQYIATANSFQSTYGGGEDAMLVKFSATGQRLWATYYGGSGKDIAGVVATNGNNKLYLYGMTESSTGMATLGSFQSSYAGAGDGFIACFTPQGTREWATYVGGANSDHVGSVVYNNGILFVCGDTYSPTGIASAGAQQQTFGGGYDMFIQKYDTAGNRIWSTYYGGTGYDYAAGNLFYLPWKNKIAIGCVTTGSTTNMTTPNGMNPNYIGVGDNSVYAEFDQQGQLSYGTYLVQDALAYSAAVDTILKRIYLVGSTSATVGVATAGAYQTANNGLADGVMACIIDSFGSFEAPYIASPLCQGQTIGVQNNLQGGAFFSNNIFTVQLSNALGSFANPTIIGVDTTPIAGNINCIIPANTPAGNAYKVRVLSSHPVAISPINNTNIVIAAIAPPPTVIIAASPQGSVQMGTPVTFTATVTNGGGTPQYQWRKNGTNINGAINNNYTTNSLVNGDTIDVLVTSAVLCAQPATDTSNAIIMSIITSIETIGAENSVIIQPNPFHDRLIVNVNQSGLFTLYTIDGRVVMQQKLMQGENSINVPAGITSGIYIAMFKNENNKLINYMKIVHE